MSRSALALRFDLHDRDMVRPQVGTEPSRKLYSENTQANVSLVLDIGEPDPGSMGVMTAAIRAMSDEILRETQAMAQLGDARSKAIVRINRDVLRALSHAETLARMRDAIGVLSGKAPGRLRLVGCADASGPTAAVPGYVPLHGKRHHP